jgi:diaminopimelate epimerase
VDPATSSSGTDQNSLARIWSPRFHRVKVQTEGGTINIEWRDDDQLVMTGRADIVYQGRWLAGEESSSS